MIVDLVAIRTYIDQEYLGKLIDFSIFSIKMRKEKLPENNGKLVISL